MIQILIARYWNFILEFKKQQKPIADILTFLRTTLPYLAKKKNTFLHGNSCKARLLIR